MATFFAAPCSMMMKIIICIKMLMLKMLMTVIMYCRRRQAVAVYHRN